jgi:hypothetical protein
MRQQFLTALLGLALGAFAFGTPAQSAASVDHPATPILRLKIIPSKETYAANETILIKTIFTNLSDKTVCFPQPVQQIHVPEQGYLAIQAERPGGPEREEFLPAYHGRLSLPHEKLLLEINQKWIKLAQNETYTTEVVRAPATIDTPGQWQLHETYLPPQGSFGVASYRNKLQAAAEEAGCILPVTPVEAETATVNIVAAPENK